jgi:integrase
VNPLSEFEMGKEQRHKSPLTLEALDLIIANAAEHLAWAIQVAWHIPCRPGQYLYSLTFSQNMRWRRGGLRVFHSKVEKWVFVRCSDEFMKAMEERRRLHKSGHLTEYQDNPVADIATAFSNAAKRAGLKYAVCPYDIRHLWITTMLDKKVEISAIAHLAGTSPRMIIKNYDEPHSSETEKAAALLPKLGAAREAPLRLVRPVRAA